MSFPLQPKLNYQLDDSGLFSVLIVCKKPADFVLKQARLKIVGEEVWKLLGKSTDLKVLSNARKLAIKSFFFIDTLAKLLGGALVASFKLAFHPLYLCNDYMNPEVKMCCIVALFCFTNVSKSFRVFTTGLESRKRCCSDKNCFQFQNVQKKCLQKNVLVY